MFESGSEWAIELASSNKAARTNKYQIPRRINSTLATTITADPAAKVEDLKVAYPEGKLIKDALVGDYRVYDGKTDIKVTLRRPKGTSPIELNLRVQACSDKQCLLPATIKLKLE